MPSSFSSTSLAEIKERNMQAIARAIITLQYYPLLSHKREIFVLLLGPVITLVISIVRHSQAFAVDPTVDKNKISDKARDVAFQQDLVSKHHLLFVDNNSVGG